jgi:hypothetical protein
VNTVDERPIDRRTVHEEMDRARDDFHGLLDGASDADLHRRSAGTRWTNEQLLYHMLFGFLLVRALLILVHLLSRLPDHASRGFARILNAATRPFDVVNYWGSRVGALVVNRRRMAPVLDRTVATLHRHLDHETEAALHSGMHYPTRWDPFFKDYMTTLDVYHFATQHFDFHAGQLTLDPHRESND